MTQLDPDLAGNIPRVFDSAARDRRDFSRISLDGITLIKTDSTTLPVINGALKDVSASGLKISLDTPLPVKSIVKLSIFIEEEDLIFLVSGVILWCAISNNKSTEPRFDCGIEILYEQDGTDFYDWRALFIA